MEQNFETMFAERCPNHTFLLSRMRCALGVSRIEFSHITTSNLHKFREYMEGEVTSNSLKTYFAVFKAFVRECHNDGLVRSDKCLSALKVKSTPQQNVALTESEVRALQQYYDRLLTNEGHKVEKDVLTLFLIECLCGARGCDVESMTVNNIHDGRLTYISKKTKVLATMPVHKRLAELLARKPKKEYSRVTKNRIVKEACKRCGIIEPVTICYHGSMVTRPKYEFCAFHTARRSFASILAAKGAPITEIAQYMSHSNTMMTNRYIKVDTNNASAAALSFFND